MIALLSPVPESHFRFVWDKLQEFHDQTIDAASPQDFPAFCDKAIRDIANGSQAFSVVNESGGQVGAVWFENAGDGIGIGHLVFERTLDPEEKVAASQEALLRTFKAGFRKIIWQLFSDNIRFERFIVKRLWAVHEGTLRQQVRRNGELVDMKLYASFPEAA